jgi:S-adenosylmethionine hydrolase
MRPGCEDFHTFHGRDLYVYLGARLAAGIIHFDDSGPLISKNIALLDYQKARLTDNHTIEGIVMKVEIPFGNIATNIPFRLLKGLYGQKEISFLNVQIKHGNQVKYNHNLPFVKSFGFAGKSDALAYADSSGFIGLAVNSGSFAKKYNIGFGRSWKVTLSVE